MSGGKGLLWERGKHWMMLHDMENDAIWKPRILEKRRHWKGLRKYLESRHVQSMYRI